MEVYIKIFNGKLIKIFDTKKDKTKKITLTTVEDFQKEAEANFYIDNKKIKTLIFNNLPKAKARVLDLPISIKLIGSNTLNLSYSGHDSQIEKYNIDLNEYDEEERKISPGLIFGGLIALGAVLIIGLSIILIGYYINYNKNNGETNYIAENTDNEIEEDFTNSTAEESEEDIIEEKEESDSSILLEEEIEENVIEEKEEEILETDKEIFNVAKLRNVVNINTPIYFYKDRDELLPGETKKINEINNYLKNYTSVEILLLGHTESINRPQNELNLSIKRAEKIKYLLKSNNITIRIKGHGANKMIIKDADEEDKYKNRRVEIEVISAE